MMRVLFALAWLGLASPIAAEEVQIGGFVIPGSPAATIFYDYAAQLEGKSNGALTANLLIHGEGGPEEQILTGLRRGRIKVASLSTLVLASIVPELGYLGAPFLFDSKDEFDFVVDTVFIDLFQPYLQDRGLTILRWLDLGGQNIYANRPILWPQDATGVRLRTTQDIASRLFLEAIGADVIYITSPETIPGLQTGLIDGGLTPTVAYAGTGLVAEAPHYMVTEHFYLGGFLVVNTRWLEGLPKEHQEIVSQSFASTSEIRQIIGAMNTQALAQAGTQGFTAHRLTADQRTAWKAASVGTHPALISAIGGNTREIADALATGRTAFAAQAD